MTIEDQDSIINYMIKKHPDSTIKDFYKELREIKDNVPIVSVRASVGSKPIVRYTGVLVKEPVKFERAKGVYSNKEW